MDGEKARFLLRLKNYRYWGLPMRRDEELMVQPDSKEKLLPLFVLIGWKGFFRSRSSLYFLISLTALLCISAITLHKFIERSSAVTLISALVLIAAMFFTGVSYAIAMVFHLSRVPFSANRGIDE